MSLQKEYQRLVNQKVGITDFLTKFSNADECLELYFNLKFDGCNCRKCGRPVTENYDRIHRKNKDGVPKKAFRCRSCNTYIYPLSDTVFRKTSIPLSHIFYIIYSLCISKRSMSGIEAAGNIGVTYKTAHRLLMFIRMILYNTDKVKMSGCIEVDEAFIGGGGRMYNWSGISTRKQPIMGLIDRDTKRLRLFLVPNRNSATITKLLLKNIEKGSTVYTDSWRGYSRLPEYYTHETVDHSKREWVRGKVHTNTIEGVWAKFKTNLRGIHIHISDKYVQLYLDEACWRHNSRGKLPMQLFNEILVRSFFSPYSAVAYK